MNSQTKITSFDQFYSTVRGYDAMSATGYVKNSLTLGDIIYEIKVTSSDIIFSYDLINVNDNIITPNARRLAKADCRFSAYSVVTLD